MGKVAAVCTLVCSSIWKHIDSMFWENKKGFAKAFLRSISATVGLYIVSYVELMYRNKRIICAWRKSLVLLKCSAWQSGNGRLLQRSHTNICIANLAVSVLYFNMSALFLTGIPHNLYYLLHTTYFYYLRLTTFYCYPRWHQATTEYFNGKNLHHDTSLSELLLPQRSWMQMSLSWN